MMKNSKSIETQLRYGVPQGSCLGPIAFLVYISALTDIINNQQISVLSYADDTQLYLSCESNNINDKIASLNSCIDIVRKFMLTHQLKINDNKTEFIILGTRKQLSKIDQNTTSIRVGDSIIKPSSSVINLGFVFDSTMSLKSQVNSVCKKSYFQLIKISQIKRYSTREITESLIHSLISSNLDYCNSLYFNITKQ